MRGGGPIPTPLLVMPAARILISSKAGIILPLGLHASLSSLCWPFRRHACAAPSACTKGQRSSWRTYRGRFRSPPSVVCLVALHVAHSDTCGRPKARSAGHSQFHFRACVQVAEAGRGVSKLGGRANENVHGPKSQPGSGDAYLEPNSPYSGDVGQVCQCSGGFGQVRAVLAHDAGATQTNVRKSRPSLCPTALLGALPRRLPDGCRGRAHLPRFGWRSSR